MGTELQRLLAEMVECGPPLLVGAGNVLDYLARLESAYPSSDEPATVPPRRRWIVLCWDRLPGVRSILDDALRAVADVARALWPGWPDATFDSAPAGGSIRPLKPWLSAAARCCAAGHPALPDGFPPATHAAQLSRLLSGQPPRLVLATCDERPLSGTLMSLARAAEWFAAEAGWSVVVVVPEGLARHEELEPISHNTWYETPPETPELGEPASNESGVRPPVGTVMEPRVRPTAPPAPAAPGGEGPIVHTWPLEGLPHPGSPGEQLLAGFLAADKQLAGLFEHNVLVESRWGNCYRTDLVWRAGRVVVEIDGFRWHTSRAMFISDRHRDYELLVSGYYVLRLAHDEVLADVHRALAKIRDVVALRQARQGAATGESP